MIRIFAAVVLLCALGLLWPLPASAAITILTVPVGNVGNANDPSDGDSGTSGVQNFGGVGYAYSIGKYEVTVWQYSEFLNAVADDDLYGLYNTQMATNLNIAGISRGGVSGSYSYSVMGSLDHPVTYVSWGDAARFSNWMHNGQPTGPQGAGTTERGAYTLDGAVTDADLNGVSRNAGARWVIPKENEWYKAAYHKNDGVTGNYWKYATSTNAVPYSDQVPGSGAPTQSNTANFYEDDGIANDYNDGFAVTGSPSYSLGQNYLTDAGAYTSAASPYGTFDQEGNVWEWNEAFTSGSFRGMRGASWNDFSYSLPSSYNLRSNPANELDNTGFRVATIPIGNNGDFDDNGVVNAADIDILWHIVRGTGTDPGTNDTADLNGDGVANEDDVDTELASKLTAGPGRHYGDADLVGGVGPDDFTAWRIGGSGWAHGDFDGTGDVGPDDFTLWRTAPTTFPSNVGPRPGSVTAVPEPATLVMMSLALPVLWLVPRRVKR